MIYWNLDDLLDEREWTTAYRLAKETGVSQPTAARILSGDPIDRLDTTTLLALARAFDRRDDPLSLLTFLPD